MNKRPINSLAPAKLRAGEFERIERLGKLNDRRLAALEANDMIELEQIAKEYEALPQPMTTTAKELRIVISIRQASATDTQPQPPRPWGQAGKPREWTP